MKQIDIKNTDLQVSNIVLGNMRIANLSLKEAETLIRTAMEEGINLFDHADIYGGGKCEEHFANAISMNSSIREEMVIQSKCGIRKGATGYYDFSKEYILTSVDGILRRLQTDYLDLLLLHRPDPLMEPNEVAEAFDQLHKSGKVRYFGVSNHNPMQIELLQKSLNQKLVVNQVQFSLAHTPLIDSGMSLNMNTNNAIDRASSTLEYCRLNDITLQAWSPFQSGFFDGPFVGDTKKYPELNQVLEKLATKYHVSPTTIAVAWITRHPANIQVVLGTTNIGRLKESAAGADIELTREEWYELYSAAGNMIP
ncbi:aldo/keto reductase [Alkalihalobacillus sp. 1P02AB]|uniref:aldo/keto reductase n=1 Tax=Alkalihalobacillus sp. 1P02AB TaxID=3132260 RepID=UPI0039A52D59